MAFNGNGKMTNCLSERNAFRGACVADKLTTEPIQNGLCTSVLDQITHAKTLRALQVDAETLREEVAVTKNAYRTLVQRMDVLDLRKSSAVMDKLDVATKFDADALFVKGSTCLHAGREFLKKDQIVEAQTKLTLAIHKFKSIKGIDNEQKPTLDSKMGQVFRNLGFCTYLRAYNQTDLDRRRELLKKAHAFYNSSLQCYERASNDGMVKELHNVMRRCSESNG